MKIIPTIKIAISLVIVLILDGCAATGTTYSDTTPNKTLATDKVRLVLFRTRESVIAFARTTAVKLDNKPVEGVKYAGFTFIDTTPGSHTITVDLPDTYGKCLLPIDVALGKEYFFQIRPRVESLNMGGAVGGYLEGSQPASPNRKDCTGSFFIEEVDQEIALEKLKDLKSSQ